MMPNEGKGVDVPCWTAYIGGNRLDLIDPLLLIVLLGRYCVDR